MAKAILVFTVNYAGIRLNVRVLPSAQDVYTEYSGGAKWRMRAELPMGFFLETPNTKFTGTVVLAGNCQLEEVVPHEVFHAVMYKRKIVVCTDDEPAAYAIGILTSRILRKVKKLIDVRD
jgi:hypothetical protein